MELSLITYRHNNLMACKKQRTSAAAFPFDKEVTSLLGNIPQEEGIAIARKQYFCIFSREIILKRTLYSNGICQLLPDIMEKKDGKASLSHITNMEEMNKSNELITYLSSGWPLRVFMPFMTSHCIMHL